MPNAPEEPRSEAKPRMNRKLKLTIAGIIAAVVLVAGIVGAVLVDRALQAKSDLTGMTAPVYFASDSQTGRFTVNIEFSVPREQPEQDQGADDAQDDGGTSDGADGADSAPSGGTGSASDATGATGGSPATDSQDGSEDEADPQSEDGGKTETVSVEMTWDDAWFFDDSTHRNDQLAFACKAISASVQAQSVIAPSAEETAAFMTHVFAALGFSNPETVSDEYGGGYTVATKTIISDSGEEKLVVAVCVHGLQLHAQNADSSALGSGFATIAAESAHATLASDITDAVKRRIGVRSSASVALLFFGQGESGDAALDAAAAAKRASVKGSALAPAESIFAYSSEAPSDANAGKQDSARKENTPDDASASADESSGAFESDGSAETDAETETQGN